MIVYDEPGPEPGQDCRVTLTEEEAIEQQREYMKRHFPHEVMPPDHILLEEFLTLMWAWKKD
jgi:hypothetical protein